MYDVVSIPLKKIALKHEHEQKYILDHVGTTNLYRKIIIKILFQRSKTFAIDLDNVLGLFMLCLYQNFAKVIKLTKP